jgi:hypothetical protein
VIRNFSDKRKKGNIKKGFQPRGQVNSAYSNINKSVKKKLETQTLNGKSKNVNTERHCREVMAKDPTLTYRDCLNGLKPCEKCGRRWHLASDCRKKASDNRKPSGDGPKKPFRKKFVKKGRVNNTVGRNKSVYSDTEQDESWVGTVFAMSGTETRSENVVVEPFTEKTLITPKARTVFSSDSDLDDYLISIGMDIFNSPPSNKTYEEVSKELEELLSDQESSFEYSVDQEVGSCESSDLPDETSNLYDSDSDTNSVSDWSMDDYIEITQAYIAGSSNNNSNGNASNGNTDRSGGHIGDNRQDESRVLRVVRDPNGGGNDPGDDDNDSDNGSRNEERSIRSDNS